MSLVALEDLGVGQIDYCPNNEQNTDDHRDETLLVSAYAFHGLSVHHLRA